MVKIFNPQALFHNWMRLDLRPLVGLQAICRVIYTANVIEWLDMVMRKFTLNRRISSNGDLTLKSPRLAVHQASKNWKAIRHLKPALERLEIMFGVERAPLAARWKNVYTVRLTESQNRIKSLASHSLEKITFGTAAYFEATSCWTPKRA